MARVSYLCRVVLRTLHCIEIPGLLARQVSGNAFTVVFAVGHCSSVTEQCLDG